MHDRPTQRKSVSRLVAAGAIALAVLLSATGPAAADVFTEVGDAGQLPATAQITPLFVGPLDSIIGNIGNPNDVDMYRITLTTGGIFSATTVGQPGTLFDTQLFLFDALGRGIVANDDVVLGGGRSTLSALLAPGQYLLAISSFNNDPVVPGGVRIFPEPLFGLGLVGPDPDVADLAVTGWTNTGQAGGSYNIALTLGGGPPVIPEPTSLALLGLGAFGAGGYLWLRKKKAIRA